MRFCFSREFSVIIIGLALVLSPLACADTSIWRLDPANSWAEFSVRYLGISNLRGSFTQVRGTAALDDQTPAKSSVDVSIDVANVNTREVDRDTQLRSDKFFDVAHWPVMTFKSTRIQSAGIGKLVVTGDLTIRGVTKEVVLAVDGPSPPYKGPKGEERIRATATMKINRQDFGIKGNAVMNNDAAAAGNEVSLVLHIDMVKQTPTK